MMKRFIALLVCTVFFSCSPTKTAQIKEGRNYIKTYVYCSCIDQGLQLSGKLDTLETSRGWSNEMIGSLYSSKGLRTILDSIAHEVIMEDRKNMNSPNRHESALGKVSYKLSCLQFYGSKKMDSIAKSFDKLLYSNN